MSMQEKMLEAEIEAGQSALKGGVVINGGASAALLAVIAEALKSPDTPLAAIVPAVAAAQACFMLGLAAAVAGMGFRYFAQRNFTEAMNISTGLAAEMTTRGARQRNAAVGLGLGSLAAFVTGSAMLYLAAANAL